MLRILKLSRHSRGLRILGLTLIRSTRVLVLLVCFQVNAWCIRNTVSFNLPVILWTYRSTEMFHMAFVSTSTVRATSSEYQSANSKNLRTAVRTTGLQDICGIAYFMSHTHKVCLRLRVSFQEMEIRGSSLVVLLIRPENMTIVSPIILFSHHRWCWLSRSPASSTMWNTMTLTQNSRAFPAPFGGLSSPWQQSGKLKWVFYFERSSRFARTTIVLYRFYTIECVVLIVCLFI